MIDNYPKLKKNIKHLILECSGKIKINNTKPEHIIVKLQKNEEKIQSYMLPE